MNNAKDLCVKVGETRDGKAIWKNIGVMLENDKGPYLLIDKTFNFAGVQDDKSSVIVSIFEKKDRQQSGNSQGGGFNQEPPSDNLDDEIPF